MSGFIKNIFVGCLDNFFGIEPNIKELINNSNKDKVIVQYNPPKGLSPSEVGMIFYRKYKASNINCLIYKWVNEGKVSIKKKGSIIHLTFLKDIEENVPRYELSFWRGLLFFKRKYRVDYSENYHVSGMHDPKNLVYGLHNIQNQLLNHCIDKGWLERSGKEKFLKNNLLIFCIIFIWGLFISFPSICFKLFNHMSSISGDMLEGFLFIWIALLVFAVWFTGWKLQELKCPTDIELTEKGKKLYSEIFGFKYFLEHCEEEKLQELIKSDPDYVDTILPYAVALRLNLSFLKYSLTNFSITKIEVDNSKLLMS